MKLIIDNVTFNFGSLSVITKERHSASFLLLGMDSDLIELALKSVSSKAYFDVRIIKGSEDVLVGESCLFDKVTPLNRTAKLIVNWVV